MNYSTFKTRQPCFVSPLTLYVTSDFTRALRKRNEADCSQLTLELRGAATGPLAPLAPVVSLIGGYAEPTIGVAGVITAVQIGRNAFSLMLKSRSLDGIPSKSDCTTVSLSVEPHFTARDVYAGVAAQMREPVEDLCFAFGQVKDKRMEGRTPKVRHSSKQIPQSAELLSKVVRPS